MGLLCCKKNEGVDKQNISFEKSKIKFEELERQIIDNEKFIIHLKYNDESNENKPDIKVDVIHVDSIGSTMPASEKYIDQGYTSPFIYNTIIQTAGVGKGNRKWAGGIKGNLYTSTGIPLNMVRNEFSDEKIIVKITSISIIQELNKYVKNEFFLKYPNDIICKDKYKLGGILVQKYKDFFIIGFGINIIDKPEQDEIRKEGLSPCFVKLHLPKDTEPPRALDLSIEVTKNILFNLNLTSEEIDKLFEQYVLKMDN